MPADVYPLAYEAQNAYYLIPFLHAFGGRMLDEKGGFGLQGEPAAQALGYVSSLLEGRVIPDEADGALVKELFSAGEAGAVIDGPWLAAGIRKGFPYRVVPLPKLVGAPFPLRPFLTVEAAMLTPTGATRPEARDFARFLGSARAAKIRAKVGRQVVANERAFDDPDIAGDPVFAAFHEAAKTAVPMPTSIAMRTTWEPARAALTNVLRAARGPRGDTDEHDVIRAALAQARASFEDFMRPPPPAPSPTPVLVGVGLLLVGLAGLAWWRASRPGFVREVKASVPAYKYVVHAALAVIVLVVLPLFAGTLTSFFSGTRDDPVYVGLDNYEKILTARGEPLFSHGSFYLTLLVTVLWTLANVTLHVIIGVALGVLLSRPLLRLKAIYRVLLILPWAVPSYVTALAWKGMFHRQFGAINTILEAFGVERISWFSKFSTAFTANVATNVWLGFPFMMVVTMGALTAIPKDVLEAAEVDGATRWQRFRLVTLPLLRPALLPAVVLGAVWTFNMFNVVFLVSGGEPDRTTDILVSDAYRWAFTRGAQYGYAAAYAVLIFFLLALGSRLLSRVGARAGEEAIV